MSGDIEFRWYDEYADTMVFSSDFLFNDDYKVDFGVSCILLSYVDGEIVSDQALQYTGKKDKNGVKIFEGDILKCENNLLWLIGFDRGCFVAHDPDDAINHVLLDDYDFKVIGNVQQNPELLEVKS